MNTFKTAAAVLLFWTMSVSVASRISLTANPEEATVFFSKTLELKCSFDNGVDVSQKTRDSFERQTYKSVTTIFVIMISKQGADSPLATISTADDRPVIYDDTDSLAVAGNVTLNDQTSPTPYLQLTWTKPDQDKEGVYTCFVHALDSVGRFVTFNATARVRVKLPNAVEQLRYMEELEKRLSYYAPHIEKGIVEWPMYPAKKVPVLVKFETPYAKVPVLFLSPVTLDVAEDKNMRFNIYAVNLTQSGFQLEFEIWGDTVIYVVRVQWMAISS
ncbi:unnamed protein product [Lymnaea stagnalis]|uniref:H-type lectin domain-containing protein n=1 Tax=Lymnaea stagnalis TaxID=6523 RepID=A0AAV2INL7_LYMST